MRPLSRGRLLQGVVFTAEEHLRVQQQIERRARVLWCAGGCRHGTTLKDWVQAEREVLAQFIRAYSRRDSLPQSSRREPAARVACTRPETRIVKRGRKLEVRTPESVSALG
jgi:hypothetical protein